MLEWFINHAVQSNDPSLTFRNKLNGSWVKLSIKQTTYVFYFHFKPDHIDIQTNHNKPVDVSIQTSLSNLLPANNNQESLSIEGNISVAENFAHFIRSLTLHLSLPSWMPGESQYLFQRVQRIFFEHFNPPNTPSPKPTPIVDQLTYLYQYVSPFINPKKSHQGDSK